MDLDFLQVIYAVSEKVCFLIKVNKTGPLQGRPLSFSCPGFPGSYFNILCFID